MYLLHRLNIKKNKNKWRHLVDGNFEARTLEWKHNIIEFMILCFNDTGIKYCSFNGFQWGHFCPEGPECNYFVYTVYYRCIIGTEVEISKFPQKYTPLAKFMLLALTQPKWSSFWQLGFNKCSFRNKEEVLSSETYSIFL